METGKRGRGRPRREGGRKVSRSLRVDGALWCAAQSIADARGETMTSIVQAAVEGQLRLYVDAHARKRPPDDH